MPRKKVTIVGTFSSKNREIFDIIQSYENRTKCSWNGSENGSKSTCLKVDSLIYKMQVTAKRYVKICSFYDILKIFFSKRAVIERIQVCYWTNTTVWPVRFAAVKPTWLEHLVVRPIKPLVFGNLHWSCVRKSPKLRAWRVRNDGQNISKTKGLNS